MLPVYMAVDYWVKLTALVCYQARYCGKVWAGNCMNIHIVKSCEINLE